MIKAVLFDVGSTLLRPKPDIDGVFHQKALNRGHRLSAEEVSQHLPTILSFYEEEYLRDGDFWCSPEDSVEMYLEMYRYLARLTGLNHDAETLAREVHESYLQPDYWDVYPDVLPTLKALSETGLRMGVVSNWSPNLATLLDGIGIAGYMDDIIASAEVGLRKPNPEVFEVALKRMKVKPHEVLHVGDRPDADGIGAERALIKPIIIDREGVHGECGYRCVSNLGELLDEI